MPLRLHAFVCSSLAAIEKNASFSSSLIHTKAKTKETFMFVRLLFVDCTNKFTIIISFLRSLFFVSIHLIFVSFRINLIVFLWIYFCCRFHIQNQLFMINGFANSTVSSRRKSFRKNEKHNFTVVFLSIRNCMCFALTLSRRYRPNEWDFIDAKLNRLNLAICRIECVLMYFYFPSNGTENKIKKTLHWLSHECTLKMDLFFIVCRLSFKCHSVVVIISHAVEAHRRHELKMRECLFHFGRGFFDFLRFIFIACCRCVSLFSRCRTLSFNCQFHFASISFFPFLLFFIMHFAIESIKDRKVFSKLHHRQASFSIYFFH